MYVCARARARAWKNSLTLLPNIARQIYAEKLVESSETDSGGDGQRADSVDRLRSGQKIVQSPIFRLSSYLSKQQTETCSGPYTPSIVGFFTSTSSRCESIAILCDEHGE